MPPSMFNEMGRNTSWDELTEARTMYQESTATGSTSGSGATWLLVGGAAVLALIVIAMALLVG